MRMRHFSRPALAIALGVVMTGCDSLPDSIGPSARDLLSGFTIWNDAPAPMTQALLHPNYTFGGCAQARDSTIGGGIATFTTRTGEGRTFNLESGCYVFFVRWEGHPGHVQVAASLGFDESKSVTIASLPTPPAAMPSDGSARVINAATQHTAAITRIYTDACVANNRFYGLGAGGGATTDNVVNVAHGASVTIPLPRTCHLITILWSNGWYQFGTYNITGANSLTAQG
jgi:hypothetical protein